MPETVHHLPPRPATARTAQPSQSTRARWAQMERTAQAIEAAHQAGHADGLRTGDAQGWHRGLWCGVVAGALLASIGWALWLTATAPGAAPPSARQQMVQPAT